ncbi:MAG: adenylosuccinate lyase, partial [Proteobacteria bacterium]
MSLGFQATALSPLDGRYADKLAPLRECFGELALVRERCRVEIAHVLALEATGLFGTLSAEELARVHGLLADFDLEAFARVKAIEAETRHDVKAVEYFLRERLELANPNRIHFGLTSEDVNNLAHTSCVSRYRETVLQPVLGAL